jgi:hypothetical protein
LTRKLDVALDQLSRQRRLDDFFDHGFAQRGQFDIRRMLRGQHDRVDCMRLAVDITHGDLRLRIRTQPGQTAVAAQVGLALDQTVRQVDRQRHQFRRFFTRIAEHQALVAGALIEVVVVCAVDALGDVRRLLVVRDEHRATAVVDAVIGVIVADALDRIARDLDIVDVCSGGDFTGQHDETGVAQRFRGNARVFVLSQDRVENRVRDLVRHLVRMAFGNRFRGEKIVVCHVADSCYVVTVEFHVASSGSLKRRRFSGFPDCLARITWIAPGSFAPQVVY